MRNNFEFEQRESCRQIKQKRWGCIDQTSAFDICPCCGVQFGYEDCNAVYVEKYREEWMKKGAKWFAPKGCVA